MIFTTNVCMVVKIKTLMTMMFYSFRGALFHPCRTIKQCLTKENLR